MVVAEVGINQRLQSADILASSGSGYDDLHQPDAADGRRIGLVSLSGPLFKHCGGSMRTFVTQCFAEIVSYVSI